MSNENTTTATETATKTPSLLDKLHAEYVKAGAKAPDAKTAKALIGEYEKASKAREAAEKAFVAAREAESAAVANIVKARGKGRFKMGAYTYVTMSRGDTVYLRREGGEDVPSFG